MKLPNESIEKIIESGASQVSYDKDSLLKSLIEDAQPSERFPFFPYRSLLHFVTIITITIAAITLVVAFSFSYVKDILLFKSNLSVNRDGVFMPNRACGREYCLFLFNTSDLWANTGIYLNKGDKFKMSVSGAFHSSLEDMRRDALFNNSSPKVRWIGGKLRNDYSFVLDSNNLYYKHSKFYTQVFGIKPPNTKIPQFEKKKYCVDTNAYIGSILYRIAPEFKSWEPNKNINVWKPANGHEFIRVDTSGVLSMAINDIYFESSQKLHEYANEYNYRFDSVFPASRILEEDEKKNDYCRMFYDDNIGQILVCLEIQHPLKGGFFNPLSAFRNLDNQIEDRAKYTNSNLLILFQSIPYYLEFVGWISILFVFYIICALISIYLLFAVGYYAYVVLKKLF